MKLSHKEKIKRIIKSQQGVLYLTERPGIGKTAILKSIAKEENWQYFDFRLSMRDSSEIIGIPKIDKQEDGAFVMDYAIPKTFIEANKRPTLIVFEELNRAVLETRNASLQVFLEKVIGNYAINDEVYFASTGNLGEEDNCDVEELDRALYGRLVPYRFDIVNMDGFQEWKSEFGDKNINSLILQFMENNPDHFYTASDESQTYTCYRSWTFFSKFTGQETKDVNKILDDLEVYGSMYLHASTVVEFKAYLENMRRITIHDVLDRYDDIKEVLTTFNKSFTIELSTKIVELDIKKLTNKQIDNVINFVKGLNEDEVLGFYTKVLDKYMENITDDDNNPIDVNKTLPVKVKRLLYPFKDLLCDYAETLKEDEDKETEEK